MSFATELVTNVKSSTGRITAGGCTYRKLSRGVFRWKFYENKPVLEVSERQFRWLLDGLSMEQPSAHKPVKQRIIL
jgi:hypothetical protein